VTITWTLPVTNGAPITAYKITIRHSNLATYSENLNYCDGSDSDIVAAMSCDIPASVLNVSPYTLAWGTSVFAKVRATNEKGASTESNAGNGAIIYTKPDSPVSVLEDTSQRTASVLAITWSAGATNGGTAVIDYQVSTSADGAAFVVLASGITARAYTATGLTAGVVYRFVVQSRNKYTISDYSAELPLLCATLPLAPDAPTTSVLNNLAVISWPEPVTNGSPITGYKVYILEYDGVTYTEEKVDCVGTDVTVIANRVCYIYLDTLIVSPYSLELNEEIWAKVLA
jgi:hypothetical protein